MNNRILSKHRAGILLCSLLAFSCAPRLPYALDYPLSSETFFSREGTFYGLVPQGWFAAGGDTLAPALSAWLVRDDLSAALTLREVHLDRPTADRVEKNGLETLAQVSLAAHLDDSSSMSMKTQPKEFSIHERRFCGYEIANSAQEERIIVFSERGKFYECEVVPLKRGWKGEEAVTLFKAQEAFLSSLVF